MADKTNMHSEYITLVLKRLAWQSFRGLLHNSSAYLELPVCIFTRTISALPDLLLVLCKVYYKLEIQWMIVEHIEADNQIITEYSLK